MRLLTLLAAILALIGLGCSSGAITAPDPTSVTARTVGASDSHRIWGLWQLRADPAQGTLEVTPLRAGAMHLNALKLLEPPAGLKLKVANLKFTGSVCDVDVTIVHPFPGLSQYIGFDVAGIVMTKGTLGGFSDPGLAMPGPGESRLLNADGWSRWWNPVEFSIPGQPIFRYRDGLLGNKDSVANFDCTLNGYKLFSDELGKDDDILSVDPTNRLPLMDGSSNTRHYTIDFSGGVVFNYAVDANWVLPDGNPPFTPDMYPPDANCPEAWAASITELENTLYNDGINSGGDLSLLIDVRDHYNAGANIVWAESPGNFAPTTAASPVGGGDGYSTYQLDIVGATPQQGSIDILIGVESEVIGYVDVLPDKPITAYFVHTSTVGLVPQNAPTAIMHATTPTTIPTGGLVSFDATDSTGTPPLTFTWDFNGDGTYDGPDDAYSGSPDTPTHTFDVDGTYDVTVKVTNSKGFDISDSVVVHVGLSPDDIYVDGDYQGTDSDGTQAKPFKTVQEGLNAVAAGHTVHVDYLDGGNNTYDTADMVLKSDVMLLGDNWNGGGPGKPKLDNATNMWVVGMSYGNLTNFILEGFELGVSNVPGSDEHWGVYITGGSNVTIRHKKVSDYADDTGLEDGDGVPIYLNGCADSIIEFNDIGPMTFHSDTPGEYATVLWGIYTYDCTNIQIRNNYIHDYLVDYDGGGGQIRVFLLHCQDSTTAEIHNNLICHVHGIGNYDYRINGINLEGYSGFHLYHCYNNTVDTLDTSQSIASTSPIGLIFYSASWCPPFTDTYVDNGLVTNLMTKDAAMAMGYVGTGWNDEINGIWYYPGIEYCTGYNISASTDFFGNNWDKGDGLVDVPGIDPLFVDNVTEPYDYRFQSGSGCEMGDPNLIDWDDTGTPSGDPDEPNIENRSRMGCFGGPDGNWDPNNL